VTGVLLERQRVMWKNAAIKGFVSGVLRRRVLKTLNVWSMGLTTCWHGA